MTNTVSDRSLSLNGLQFHYRDWGGHGRSLVMLHGLASNSHIWDLVAPLLTRRFSVVALDQRNHGESAEVEEGFDFSTTTNDLALFVEAKGLQKPIVVGHSWGAHVAMELGATRPSAVSGLVLVDGGFMNLRSRPDLTWEEVEKALAPPDLTHLSMGELVSRARESRWADMWRPEVEAVLRGSFRVQSDGTIRPRLSREKHMKIVRAMWDQQPLELFPRVTAPVLILPARQNGEGPPGMIRRVPKEELVAQAEALLPRARTVWLEDSIHDVPLQRPELVARVILEAADGGFFGS